jgi:uncharacterized protein
MDLADAGRSLRSVTWPMAGLDVDRLIAGGWRPQPFSQFILKVHSRCNLACDYCYIYEAADQGWRDQPKIMRDDVFETACRRIADHARTFGIPAVNLVLHGGEPLMIGAARLDKFARVATDIVGSQTRLRLGMQTNGVLFDEAIASICAKWNVRVAVSVDGDRTGHNRHRRFRNGAASYEEVSAGIAVLAGDSYRHLYAGLLCTIDVSNDPIATYEALAGFNPPGIDFLLPHGNWTAPPPRRGPGDPPIYGDWLVKAFDRWYDARYLETSVRLFEDIIALLLGRGSRSEAIGLLPIRVAVVETDGSLEQVDTLKTAYAGATKMSNLGPGNPLDLALWTPQIAARQIGVAALSETCRACRIHRVCGAGNYTHRYRAGGGFKNPSVFCPDLMRLITHIERRVSGEITRLTGTGRHVDK